MASRREMRAASRGVQTSGTSSGGQSRREMRAQSRGVQPNSNMMSARRSRAQQYNNRPRATRYSQPTDYRQSSGMQYDTYSDTDFSNDYGTPVNSPMGFDNPFMGGTRPHRRHKQNSDSGKGIIIGLVIVAVIVGIFIFSNRSKNAEARNNNSTSTTYTEEYDYETN